MSNRVTASAARKLCEAAGIPYPEKGKRDRRGRIVGLSLLPEGAPGAWSVEVPGFALLSLNRARNRHWSAEYRMKTRTAEVVGPCLWAAGVTRAKGRRRVSFRVDRPDGKHADEENLRKILNDPLVWLGVLRDDGPEWAEAGRYTTGIGPRRTVLTIEDVDSQADHHQGRQ